MAAPLQRFGPLLLISITLNFRLVTVLVADFFPVIHTMSVFTDTGLGNYDVERLRNELSLYSVGQGERKRTLIKNKNFKKI